MRLIDAIVLISKAQRMETTDNNGIPVDTFAVPVLAIEDAPTVDAKPVIHARWEQGDYYDFGDVCSNCDWDSERDNCKWSYCPNCGAKMK